MLMFLEMDVRKMDVPTSCAFEMKTTFERGSFHQ
jgi:hypothetical protein